MHLSRLTEFRECPCTMIRQSIVKELSVRIVGWLIMAMFKSWARIHRQQRFTISGTTSVTLWKNTKLFFKYKCLQRVKAYEYIRWLACDNTLSTEREGASSNPAQVTLSRTVESSSGAISSDHPGRATWRGFFASWYDWFQTGINGTQSIHGWMKASVSRYPSCSATVRN